MDKASFDAWWKPKTTNLLAVLYAVVLAARVPFADAAALLLPSLVTILGIGIFGHLLNDWFDLDADRAVGKPNRLEGLPLSRRWGLVATSLAIALSPWSILPWDGTSVGLLLLEFALFAAYAVPPLRLKERGAWAVLADGAYAYAVPAVLAAHTFGLRGERPVGWTFFGPLFCWQLSLGARHFLNHVALDRWNDLETRTPTLATRRGNGFIHLLVRRLVLPAEILTLLAFLVVLGGPGPALALSAVLLLVAWSGFDLVLAVGRGYPLPAYRFSRSHLDGFDQEVLPLLLLVPLVARDWRFAFVLAGHVLLFRVVDKPLSLLGRRVRAALRPQGAVAPQLPGPAARPDTIPPAPTIARTLPPDPAIEIAIVNINKSKYTETFVRGPLSRLPFHVHYLHGGELPLFDADDRHFLSNWPSLQALAPFLEAVLQCEPDHFLTNSVAGYLQSRRIRLVLAHFGPVGVRMLPIARDLGIPLIVCFHGYDVFHRGILDRWEEGYRRLFREAVHIVAVSEEMVSRLASLGAPREKLVHLPAFVDLAAFPRSDHARIGPRFLAVGRFAETKSPHLTILAFARVVQRVPQATLTMVGKGGGGELFEACLILVRSLRLEDRVELKGVLTHQDVAAEMRAARVFVQHSVTTPENGDREGKPVAVMEAMACGLPVVATRHSGISELIEDGLTGFLVDEYDVEAMAEVMVRLAQDDSLVAEVGRAASDHVHGHPLLGHHVAQLERLIRAGIAAG